MAKVAIIKSSWLKVKDRWDATFWVRVVRDAEKLGYDPRILTSDQLCKVLGWQENQTIVAEGIIKELRRRAHDLMKRAKVMEEALPERAMKRKR
jgi:hypothetical protein